MAHSGFAELPRAHATTVPNNINTMRNKCQLHACRTHGIAWPWLPIWMIHLYHLLPASDLKLCQPRSKAGPTSALALTSKDIVAFLSSLCSLLVAQCLRLENIKSMTASQQIRCTRYTKWIQMDNEWTWKMKLGSSMISKLKMLKMLKMLKQLSTLIPGLAPQNSPSWSGDHLVVNQKLKQLPQSGHRRAQGCYRLLSQVTVSNARPAKTSTYINHAFHNMVIDHRSLYKFVLLHQIPSLHPSFGANPYRMDFGRLSQCSNCDLSLPQNFHQTGTNYGPGIVKGNQVANSIDTVLIRSKSPVRPHNFWGVAKDIDSRESERWFKRVSRESSNPTPVQLYMQGNFQWV